VAALSVAGEARSDPTVIYCQGYMISKDAATGDIGNLPSSEYYKFDTDLFEYWNSGGPTWTPNVCAKAGATCHLDDDAFSFSMKGDDGSGSLVVINRKTGKSSHSEFQSDGSQTSFLGDCRLAPDPQPTGPNKF
jgi:hypothetical protein